MVGWVMVVVVLVSRVDMLGCGLHALLLFVSAEAAVHKPLGAEPYAHKGHKTNQPDPVPQCSYA